MTNLVTKQVAYVSRRFIDHVAIFYKLIDICTIVKHDRMVCVEINRFAEVHPSLRSCCSYGKIARSR